MLLAFLVYAVSNLTYNSTLFFWLGLFPLLLWAVSYLVNLFSFSHSNYVTTISKGKEYKLIKQLGSFAEGSIVRVEEIYKYSEQVGLVCERRYESIPTKYFKDAISADKYQTKKLNIVLKNSWLVIGFLFLVLHTVLPNRQTAIYVAGAWMVQTVLTDEKTQKLGAAAYDATLNQLETWSKENKDLELLLQSVKKEVIAP